MTHYTLTNFVRQASNTLLADYLEHQDVDLGIDVRSLKARETEPITAAINELPDDTRSALDQDFRSVTTLADKAGLLHIIDEARYRGIEIEAGLQDQNSFVNKSLWVFLAHRAVHDVASQFAVPYTQGRYWKRRLQVTSAPGIELETRKIALEAALKTYFVKEEGRGRACKIEYLERRPIHSFFAYPEDFSAAPLAWNSNELKPHRFRPAFEVIFVYHEIEGTLDIYFEGRKKTVERLWQFFAETVLGVADLPKAAESAYAIDQLKSPEVEFVRPPGSEIADIRIKGLKFLVLGHRTTTLALETDVSSDPNAIHSVVRRTFAVGAPEPNRFSLSQTKVIGARIQATIDRRDGKKPRRRTFDISEGSCNLKYDGVDGDLRRMLVDSRIDRTGASSDDVAEPSRRIA